jgi:UDP-N-acetylglucosamine:LPS N-acetylglucosamine transferase
MKVLFVLGSGGHTTRSLILSKQMRVEKFFVVPWESEMSKKKVNQKYFSVVSPRYKAKSNKVLTIIRTLFLFLHSIFILMIVRPNVVVSTGSGISVPPFLVAKALGFRTVFIESPSRVYKPSIAGKMLMGKTTKWLSSWKELAERYREVEYGGIII